MHLCFRPQVVHFPFPPLTAARSPEQMTLALLFSLAPSSAKDLPGCSIRRHVCSVLSLISSVVRLSPYKSTTHASLLSQSKYSIPFCLHPGSSEPFFTSLGIYHKLLFVFVFPSISSPSSLLSTTSSANLEKGENLWESPGIQALCHDDSSPRQGQCDHHDCLLPRVSCG